MDYSGYFSYHDQYSYSHEGSHLGSSSYDTSFRDPNEVDKNAKTYWFFKNQNAELPSYAPENVIKLSHLNPSHEIVFYSNDPQKVENSFEDMHQDSRYENVQFENPENSIDTTEFPTVKLFSDAVLSTAPQLTKDLWSYLASREHPGISFDADTKWLSPIPDPLTIDGDFCAHVGWENGIFAYQPRSTDHMKGLLDNIEDNIKKQFKIKTSSDGIKWTPLSRQFFGAS